MFSTVCFVMVDTEVVSNNKSKVFFENYNGKLLSTHLITHSLLSPLHSRSYKSFGLQYETVF